MKILGYNYSVDCKRSIAELGGNSGLCSMDKQLLQVASDLPKDGMESTILHEIIEALNYHLELKLEHQQISGIESGLHQVLTSNGVNLRPLFLEEE